MQTINNINKNVADFFSSLSDETRLKIIISISKGSKTVSQIHRSIEGKITLSAISHQLKLLESMDIIKHERKGREKHYSLSGDFCWCILKDAIKHFKNKK